MSGERSKLIAAVLLAALVSVPLIMSVEYDAADPATPQERYPDADIILTEDRSSTVITSKEYADDGSWSWEVRSIPRGSDIGLMSWSEARSSLDVVIDGASVGELALVVLDDVSFSQKYLDVSFTMVSGSIDRLMMVKVDPSQKQFLGNDYNNVFPTIDSASISIRGGTVNAFVPTSDLVYIDSMHVSVGTGATVHRFLTSGENGSYGYIGVLLDGGNVGYMSNVKSRIGDIEYSFEAGSIDYFCIGSDTEAGSNTVLSGMNTSFITGNVTVTASDAVGNRSAIIGGGVVEPPTVLCNGQSTSPSTVKSIVIDAPGMVLNADTCFLTEKRTSAYKFSSYRYGSAVYTSSLSDTYHGADGSASDVYGTDGVWSSFGGFDLNSGVSFFSGSVLTIHAGDRVWIDTGARMVVTDSIRLYGTIVSNGSLMNNSVIEVHDSGEIVGKVGGSGFVADHIRFQGGTESISVMSSRDTVLIQQDSTGYVETLSAVLGNGERSVVITAPEGIGFRSPSFLIALTDASVSEGFDTAFDLQIQGIDSRTLSICTVTVTVPVEDVPTGYMGQVFWYDEEQGRYSEVGVVDSSSKSLTFDTGSTGHYQIRYVPSNVDIPDDGEDNDLKVALLLMGIAAVGILMVYTVFKRN